MSPAVPVRILGPRGDTEPRSAPCVVVPGQVPLAVSVHSVGLACCGVEVAAALAAAERSGRAISDTGVAASVMVVAGTLTDVMVPALRARYRSMAPPVWVVAFGACADCGGPYWDSYSVTKGVDQVLPVDLMVAGCPPRPEALLAGLRSLAERIRGGEKPAGHR